jgi:KDO2-lipid IV(A) lauroyltransferase
VRWALEGVLLRACVAILSAVPERVALALGAGVGRLTARLPLRYRERALANLGRAYPEWSQARRNALLSAAFAELGRTTAEWARLPALAAAEVEARVEWRGVEHLEGALARGRGALVVTAHHGSWEIIPVAGRLRFRGHEVTAVARTIPNPHAQAVIEERRNLFGGATLPQDARQILRALRRNAAIGVLVDQYLAPRRGGILAPFMGLRTWTNPGPALLALRTGAALLPVGARREADGRYCVEFGPEFTVVRRGDPGADAAALTAAINAWVESLVRARPELWLWGHRRWHHSPDARGLYRPRVKRGRRARARRRRARGTGT